VTASNGTATSAPQTIALTVTPEAPTLTIASPTLTVSETHGGARHRRDADQCRRHGDGQDYRASGDATLTDSNHDTLTITAGSITLSAAELAG